MNLHKNLSRTHLICDFESTPALLELLASADKGLGVPATQKTPSA